MYGQKNYLAIIGIRGVYRIDQTGCFITAFANLLTRKGKQMDPLAVNATLVNANAYIDVGDGVRDDVYWTTITALDPAISVSRIGNGWPSSSNAIVKFHYQSISHPTLANGQPNMIDHFCLVADAGARTIVDSWDGLTKGIPAAYGAPVSFAEYNLGVGQAVTPAASSPTYEVVENYPDGGKWVQLNKQPTNLWGMNYRDLSYMSQHPVEVHGIGEKWQVTNKVRHSNGYYYYRRDGQVDGFNVLDCDDYTPLAPVVEQPAAPALPSPAPPVEPVLPQLNYVTYSKPAPKKVAPGDPIDIWNFSTATSLDQISSIGQLQAGADFEAAGEVQTLGFKFYLKAEDLAAKNGHGVYAKDLVDVETSNPELDPGADLMKPADPNAWQKTFSNHNAGEWDAEEEYIAHDLSDPSKPGIRIPKGQLLHVFGDFMGPDGKGYCRFETKTYGKDHWYGVPPVVIGADAVEVDNDMDFDLSDIIDRAKKRRPKNVRERIAAIGGLLWDAVASVLHKKQKGVKK